MAATKRLRGSQSQLLAILICERVLMEADNVASLMRVIDTFNFEMRYSTVKTSAVIDANMFERIRPTVMLKCWVFTKWYLRPGDYVEKLNVLTPKKKELRGKTLPFIQGGKEAKFHQIRHEIEMEINQSGLYRFKVYLNGRLMGEHPFTVNIKEVEE